MDEEGQPSKKSAQGTETTPPIQVTELGNTLPAQPATEEHLTKVEGEMNAFERSTLRWTKVTFAVFAGTMVFVALQWIAMRGQLGEMRSAGEQTAQLLKQNKDQVTALQETAKASRDTLTLTRQDFRSDQRPYIGLTDTVLAKFEVRAANKPHPGFVVVEVHTNNYGKSPAIELGRDAHVAIGTDQLKRVRRRAAKDQYIRILLPGEKPSIFAYSDEATTPEIFSKIQRNQIPIIVYGHIEYTDTFGEPKPTYETDFCFAVVSTKPDEPEPTCRDKNHIK